MSRDADAADEELMLRYRDGDAGAFDVLYRRHKGGLYRYLLRQCRDAAAAEELFQDVWMNLIRARAGYEVSARFTTYLYRLGHNRLVDHYRKNAHAAMLSYDDEAAPQIDEPAAPHHTRPDANYDMREQAAQLMRLLADLPEAQREAFVLQQEAGMSVEEIAAATGVARETAKSRLRYAMARLRQGMKPWA
jgi:RNA polymerase sigma-70 factor (ECF subfamily)